MIESDHKPGTNESNHELFQSLPIAECSHSLNGQHNHVRDADTRIKSAGHMMLPFFKNSGGERKEIFNAKCECGNIKRMEVTL